MSFIRTKRIAGKEYAYLVKNKWYKRGFKGKGKGPRQSVSKYLGRVYVFDRVNDVDFLGFNNLKDFEQYLISNTEESVIKDLVNWELHKHNIGQEFMVDFGSKKIRRGGKEVSLKINEGFLCSYTLRRLFNLKSDKSYYLAKCFVDAGIEIPKEVFVGLFGG